MADAVAAQNAAAAASPSSSQPAQAPVGEATLSKLPEKLQNLTRPVVVTGTVAGETPDGMTRVRTAAGEVVLKSPVPLPADKPVTLQIPAGSPPPKAMVLAQLPTQTQAPAAASPPLTNQAANQAANQPANAAQVILQSVANAVAAAPSAQLPPVGALMSAVVLAANPKTAFNAAPPSAATLAAGAAAPLGGGGGKGDGAGPGKAALEGQGTGSATPTASGGVTGRGAAHGQPVELGGDAAHRGTMLDPPPGKPGPGPGPGVNPTPGKPGDAPPQQQPGQQPGQQPPAGQQTPTPQRPGAPPLPGGPQAGPSGQPQPAPPPGQSPTPSASQAPPRSPAVGLTVREFAPSPQAPSPPNSPNSPPSSPQPQGAPTQARPAPSAATQAQPALPTAPPPSGAPSQTAPPASPAGPPPLQNGQMLAFKVLAATPPPSPLAPPPSGPAPPPDGAAMMEGEIAGLTPQGKPILAVKDGMLALNTDLRPPTGSRLTLQWLDPAALALEKAAPAPGGLLDFLQGRDWSALKAALAALHDLDPTLAQQFLAAAMPQPNRKLGAALTFLISAMRGGDARGWLGGDAARGLQRAGKESLLAALEQEFRNVDKQTSEKLPEDWRGVTLPIYDQSGINPLHLYFHPLPDPEKPEDKPGAPKATRFVLDVELSRLGPLQLDGMVKPPQFDMILRSRSALPAELRDELRAIFADSLAAVGYAGGLTFKADVRGWVNLARAGSSAPGVSA